MAFVPGLVATDVTPQKAPQAQAEVQADEVLFRRYLNQALHQTPPASPAEERTPRVPLYQTLNLLGGQYPPPDGGVGYLHVSIAIEDSTAY